LGGLPPKIFLNQQNISNIDKKKNSNIALKIVVKSLTNPQLNLVLLKDAQKRHLLIGQVSVLCTKQE
jgi:hypothetical protein